MQQYLLKSGNLQDIVKKCSASLKKPGSFLLVPTETVYGLVCSWNDILGREHIYKAKKRAENKPFQMLVSNVKMVKSFGGIISPLTEKIVQFFCPGPITIVIPTKDRQTIGFRIPECKFILKLIESHMFPLAGTSANLSGKPPALLPRQILSELKLMPDIVVDNGLIAADSLPSTVLKISGPKLEILREGPISLEEIQKVANQKN
jgi:L-threonylcarbamoyladenylate synthase